MRLLFLRPPPATTSPISSRSLSLLPSSLSPPLLVRARVGGRGRLMPSTTAAAAMTTSPPPATVPRRRRFAVLKTGHASDYTERTHGGYGQMLARFLSDEDGEEGGGEHWDIFPVVDGDFSFMADGGGSAGGDFTDYDGYVITGSAADAHADFEWILRLNDALALLHRRRKKLLGLCFGHQILARALGGKTGRAPVGWELGLKRLHLDSGAISQLYSLELPPTLNVIESHRDQVLLAPPGAIVLAYSEKTKIEMFAVGDHVLGIQCHPEFSDDVVMDIIHSRLSGNIISAEIAKEAIESFEKSQLDQELLKTLCKRFLKGCQK